MKLYYSPGACSLSPHIVLHETGLAHESEKVDLRARTTAGGAKFDEINPKGYVPALALDGGEMLTEGPAIVQYLADLKPDSKLAPANGTLARYKLQEWLNFISTELHKQFSPLFRPESSEDMKKTAMDRLNKRFGWLNTELSGRLHVMGEQFTVADAYLFTMLNWTRRLKLDMSAYPALQKYFERVEARPGVQAAMRHEGLIK